MNWDRIEGQYAYMLELARQHASAWRRAREWYHQGRMDDWRHACNGWRAEHLGAFVIDTDVRDGRRAK